MARKVSSRALSQMERKYKSALARVRRVKDEGERIAGQLQGAAITTGTAFGLSYMSHRFRDENGQAGIEIVGVPLDLGLGLGLHVATLFGVFGKWAEGAAQVANGALASWGTTIGASMGTEAYNKLQSGNGGGALPAGDAAAEGLGRTRMRDLAGL